MTNKYILFVCKDTQKNQTLEINVSDILIFSPHILEIEVNIRLHIASIKGDITKIT
jgi:hypothetical protein